MTNKCECKGCEKRHPGCHSNCESYQKFWEERRAMCKARMEEKEANGWYWTRMSIVERDVTMKKKAGRKLKKSWHGE